MELNHFHTKQICNSAIFDLIELELVHFHSNHISLRHMWN